MALNHRVPKARVLQADGWLERLSYFSTFFLIWNGAKLGPVDPNPVILRGLQGPIFLVGQAQLDCGLLLFVTLIAQDVSL